MLHDSNLKDIKSNDIRHRKINDNGNAFFLFSQASIQETYERILRSSTSNVLVLENLETLTHMASSTDSDRINEESSTGKIILGDCFDVTLESHYSNSSDSDISYDGDDEGNRLPSYSIYAESTRHLDENNDMVHTDVPNNAPNDFSTENFTRHSSEENVYFVDAHIIPLAEDGGEEKEPFSFEVKGVVLCNELFPFFFNKKILLLIFGIILIASIATIVSIKERKQLSSSTLDNTGISRAIFELSGNQSVTKGTPQAKALQWIFEDGETSQNDVSARVQRYVMMTLFFSLSGDGWKENSGYGSKDHECTWHGVSCTNFRVKNIILYSNDLKGQLPPEIGALENLQYLHLAGNHITGTLPPQMGQLKNLRFLILNHNSISGFSDEFYDMTALNKLYLGNNLFKGPVSSSFGNMSELEVLFLNANKFSGAIPSGIENLSNLISLNFMTNELNGTIPSFFGNFAKLKVLVMGNNQLSGTLPESLGNLSNLKKIYFSSNELSGTIPGSLYQLPVITDFMFADNSLSGTIPESIAFKKVLEAFTVSFTKINGTIPSSFEDFINIERLNLHWTGLNGTIPSSLCSSNKLINFTADCAGENPRVGCTCCNMCF